MSIPQDHVLTAATATEIHTQATDRPFPYFLAGLGAVTATTISFYTMFLHLKNYRRPDLQRLTIRILWMVPIYAIASFISLWSRGESDYIDTFRDMYEGFVIYSFFLLCINYLGGERALLAMLDERMRTHHLWPFNLCFAPMDMSDPDTFLFVRRGILQYVILKPFISLATMIFRLTGHYPEGYIGWDSSYLWLSLLYNVSVSWSLYCLVLFYVQCSKDLRPYRPMPKFICVKSIVFLTFYQGLGIAFLVWAGWIHDSEEYTVSRLAQLLQDCLVCLEMPFLAALHWYAFPWTDYNDERLSSRIPLYYALRDTLGIQDIIQDTYHTFKGTTFRRTRAQNRRQQRRRNEQREGGDELGLEVDPLVTYSKKKARAGGRGSGGASTTAAGGGGYGAFATPSQSKISIDADDNQQYISDTDSDISADSTSSSQYTDLEFIDPAEDAQLERQYEQSRLLPYGDYNYPVVLEDERFRYPPEVERGLERWERAWREGRGVEED